MFPRVSLRLVSFLLSLRPEFRLSRSLLSRWSLRLRLRSLVRRRLLFLLRLLRFCFFGVGASSAGASPAPVSIPISEAKNPFFGFAATLAFAGAGTDFSAGAGGAGWAILWTTACSAGAGLFCLSKVSGSTSLARS